MLQSFVGEPVHFGNERGHGLRAEMSFICIVEGVADRRHSQSSICTFDGRNAELSPRQHSHHQWRCSAASTVTAMRVLQQSQQNIWENIVDHPTAAQHGRHNPQAGADEI